MGGGAELRCFTTLGSKSWCEVAASGDAVLPDAEIRRHRHPEPHNPAVLCDRAVTGVTVPVVNLKVLIRLLPGWIHCTNWNHAAVFTIVWPCIMTDSLWIKPTDALNSSFVWYYDSTCFGQPFCPSSGVLSCTSDLVHFMQLWPFAARSRMERSSILLYQSGCTAKNSWWGAERLPETCRVAIPIKLEFSASVGFIHKESDMMHGHTIVKFVVFL